MNVSIANVRNLNLNQTHFTSQHSDNSTVATPNNSKALSMALMGLAMLGAATLQSCETDFDDVANEAFNDCPYQATVFTDMPEAKQRVDYVFQNLGLLPKDKSIVDVDSICFSDKNGNRIQLVAPRDSVGNVKMDMNKIAPNGDIKKDEALISNWGDRKIRISSPLMPSHHNSTLFQSEFWDEPGRKKDTFTEIRNESGDTYYNHYCVEKTKNGFQSRAAKGRGDASKTETYSNVNVALKTE